MLTKAINMGTSDDTDDDAALTSLKTDACIVRADGRAVDTRLLWSPDRATLGAALDLAIACAIADGSASITL